MLKQINNKLDEVAAAVKPSMSQEHTAGEEVQRLSSQILNRSRFYILGSLLINMQTAVFIYLTLQMFLLHLDKDLWWKPTNLTSAE